MGPSPEAARTGDKEMVTVLMQNGADPHLRSNDGKTAAEMARTAGRGEIMKLLL
jgi:ankyrin repeat protein